MWSEYPGPSGGRTRTVVAEHRMRSRESGDRHAVRRARHVVETHAVAELHRRRIPPVLAADPQLDAGARGPAPLHPQLDQLADALLVEGLERVGAQQLELEVLG